MKLLVICYSLMGDVDRFSITDFKPITNNVTNNSPGLSELGINNERQH